MIGWVIAGAVLGAALLTAIDRFWNDIAGWLNNTAANAVGASNIVVIHNHRGKGMLTS